MENIYLRVKGIIKQDDKYLLIKRWVDDRIPDPFLWEFVDAEVNYGEAPDEKNRTHCLYMVQYDRRFPMRGNRLYLLSGR